MTKKLKELIIAEIIALVILIPTILFKYYTDNIFFPELGVLIFLSILGMVLLGLGIWFKKL
jgi:hypothetical protein